MNVTISKSLWWFTASCAHFFAASFLTLLLGLHLRDWLLPFTIAGTILAAIKEFYFDQHYETVDERGSNLLDFVMYAAGILVGACLVVWG